MFTRCFLFHSLALAFSCLIYLFPSLLSVHISSPCLLSLQFYSFSLQFCLVFGLDFWVIFKPLSSFLFVFLPFSSFLLFLLCFLLLLLPLAPFLSFFFRLPFVYLGLPYSVLNFLVLSYLSSSLILFFYKIPPPFTFH